MNAIDLEKLISSKTSINGFLFDLDGTLADTMELHFKSYKSVIGKMGGVLHRSDFFDNIGPPAKDVIPIFASLSGLGKLNESDIKMIHKLKKSEFATIINKEPLLELPAINILRSKAKKFKTGVVTSGNNYGAKLIIKNLEIFNLIDVLITSDDVVRGKPHKEPYEKALKSINLDSSQVLAFEDSKSGIYSANAAGITVIDVVSGKVEVPND